MASYSVLIVRHCDQKGQKAVMPMKRQRQILPANVKTSYH